MAAEDIKTLRATYSAFQRSEGEELPEHVAHDIEWNLPEAVPWGGTHHGPGGIQAFLEIFHEHVEGSWADPDEFLDAGDRVVVLGRMRGRSKAHGTGFEVAFAHVWGLTDGVPSSMRSYFDTAPVMAALRGEEPS
jgi:ketosteroid isomerase-like protein